MPPSEVTTTTQAPAKTPDAVSRPIRRWLWAAAALLVALGLFWRIPLWMSESRPFRAEMTADGIEAFNRLGKQLWVYGISPGDQSPPGHRYAPQVLAGAEPGVLAATSHYEQIADGTARSGELLWITPKGVLSHSFSFHDKLTDGVRPYAEPWVISDFRVDERGAGRRIAVSGRHLNWWASVVTVLNEQWRRQGTFYNAGWVDQVHWLSPNRILVSGYANAHDGGMVGIVDAAALDGQSPAGTDPKYQCSTCGSESAVRYVVFPRSEVNLASGASLNGAVTQLLGDRVLVRTIEFHRLTEAVEVLYEFTLSLELVRASYGDRYWEMHKALETEGKIGHTRDRCPFRDGPQGIRVWEPALGWRPLNPK